MRKGKSGISVSGNKTQDEGLGSAIAGHYDGLFFFTEYRI